MRFFDCSSIIQPQIFVCLKRNRAGPFVGLPPKLRKEVRLESALAVRTRLDEQTKCCRERDPTDDVKSTASRCDQARDPLWGIALTQWYNIRELKTRAALIRPPEIKRRKKRRTDRLTRGPTYKVASSGLKF